MRSFVLPLALLFIALGVPSNAQKSAAAAAESEVAVGVGAPLRIECQLRVEQRAEWRVNGTGAPAADLRADTERAAGGGVLAVLAAPRARPHHAGLYRCARDPPSRAVRVRLLQPDLGEVAPTAAEAAREGAADVGEGAADVGDLVHYQVGRLHAFQLNCSAPPPGHSADDFTYIWKVNETDLTEVATLKDRYELLENGAKFRVKGRAHEDDYGNYSCSIGGPPVRAWRVHGFPIAKLPANLNVVEGQKLKVTCRIIGKPYPAVEWVYLAEASAADNGTEALAVLGARGELRDSAAGVPRGELLISAAQRSDAGVYRCVPAGARPDDVAETTVRVKGMYDALWPFLGICAEVFLLCAIILVYEKRRTKPELDDSDTDNHDQKKS